jgi:CheY-like chemotaxis protein
MTNSPHILVVDDDRQIVSNAKKVLEDSGYIVTTSSGNIDVAATKNCKPDLMILDLDMAEPGGFDFLRTLRSELPYLRILGISGYQHGALLGAAELLGATATLQKPFTAEALVAKIREIIGGAPAHIRRHHR